MTTSCIVVTEITIALMVLVAIGCGNGDQLATYRAGGKVVYRDGKPLEGGTIIFESVDHPVSARSVIDPDGTFRLGTYDEDDGAVAGPHRVAISPPMDMTVDRDEVRPKQMIHPRYKDIDASGLKFQVSADGPNEFEVSVSRR